MEIEHAREMSKLLLDVPVKWSTNEKAPNLPAKYGHLQHVYCDIKKSVIGGWLLTCGDDVFVLLRGTKNTREWASNLLKWHSRHGAGGTHYGIYNASLTPFECVKRYCKNLLGTNGKVHLAGHSRGGAFAVMFAYRLHGFGFPVGSVYTFGAPRVGDGYRDSTKAESCTRSHIISLTRAIRSHSFPSVQTMTA